VLAGRALGAAYRSEHDDEAAVKTSNALERLIRALGLPGRLRDVGIEEPALLPLAEAALFRAPVVCTDLQAFREVASTGPRFVPVSDGPTGFTKAVLAALNEDNVKTRRRILHDLSWDSIIEGRLEPLLKRK